MHSYDPYRRIHHRQPTRTFTMDQINQIEATLQELEDEAAKWKQLAQKWEATAREEQARASQLEGQLQKQQEKMRQVEEQVAQKQSEADTAAEMVREEQESIQQADDQIAQMQTHLMQAQAEYENARKRLEKRYANMLDQNIMDFLRDLLPVLDNLDRAIEHAQEHTDNEGVKLTRQMFLSTLEKHGIKPVEAMGVPFDPELHEALGTIEDQSLEPGMVAKVAVPGFTYRGKLLRPVQVLITPEE